jgi:hypothetical protein
MLTCTATTKAMRKRLPKQGEIVKQDQKTLLALLALAPSIPSIPSIPSRRTTATARPNMRATCRRAQARYGGLLAADRSQLLAAVERADAGGRCECLRCQRQGGLRETQENGACRCRRGEAEGLALAARTPASSVGAGRDLLGQQCRGRFWRGGAASAPRSRGALRLSR